MTRLLPWFMWVFPLAFFAFQFILRLFPGLVISEFYAKYHISAVDYGLFASLYYFGYASMQIPVALLLDKIGPRIVISLSALLCAFSTWLLVASSSWELALVSRFLIGVGSVVGFLGTSKVISQWFPQNRYAQLVGLSFSFGLLGAVYGGRPVSFMIDQLGWQEVAKLLSLTALALGVLTFLFLRGKNTPQEEQYPVVSSLKQLFSYKPLIVLAFANLLMVGALEGFADVWGVSYLMSARGIAKGEAAGFTTYIFVGMLFGGPILGFFAEKFKAHHSVILFAGMAMAVLMTVVLLFNPYLSDYALIALMFLTGILCCYQVVIFAVGAQLVPIHLMGITIALLNCINMFGGSFFHSMIGALMDYYDPNTLVDGVRVYSLEAYTYALCMIPICSLLGAALVLYSKRMQNNLLLKPVT
ncbi:MAG: MFS transporter [Candidatus Berkiella sp.]